MYSIFDYSFSIIIVLYFCLGKCNINCHIYTTKIQCAYNSSAVTAAVANSLYNWISFSAHWAFVSTNIEISYLVVCAYIRFNYPFSCAILLFIYAMHLCIFQLFFIGQCVTRFMCVEYYCIFVVIDWIRCVCAERWCSFYGLWSRHDNKLIIHVNIIGNGCAKLRHNIFNFILVCLCL